MKRNPFVSIAISTFSSIPETALKHWIRTIALSFSWMPTERFFVNRDDTVLLVGTPSSDKVKYVANIIGKEGRLIVVEPEEDNFRSIHEDKTIQNAANIKLINKAAWSKKENITFIISKNPFDHRIDLPEIIHDNDFVKDNYIARQEVEADTIDNIISELNIDHIDFAVVHVNGAELEVLKGMKNTLSKISRIHVKGHPKFAESNQPINTAVASALAQRGFKTKISRGSDARPEAISAAQWLRRDGDVYGSKTHSQPAN